MRQADSGRDLAKKQLERLGFLVTEIPEDSKEKRADLRAEKNGETAFVEVKTRTVDAELRRMMEGVPIGQARSKLTHLGAKSSTESDIKRAAAQLDCSASQLETRVLWFLIADSPFLHGAATQIISTLLGVKIVAGMADGAVTWRPCFFAGHAALHKYPSIDAVVLAGPEGFQLIPNPFSPRAQSFRSSAIFEAMKGALQDYAAVESAGQCYVVDFEVARKDEQAVLAGLRKKYPRADIRNFAVYVAGDTVTTIDASAPD